MAGARFTDEDYTSHRAVNLLDPALPQDAATKHYVDTAIFGGGLVSSVFGRSGAVIAAINDYSFAQIGSKPTTLSGYGINDAQPLNSNLTAIAALITTPFGIGSLEMTNAVAFRAYIGAGDGTFTSLTGKPTTLSGYGITDAQPLDAQLTSLAALNYGTNALKVIRVNAGETGFEFATAGAAGVTSITGTSPIVVSPTTGAVVASLNMGADFAWTTSQSMSFSDSITNTIIDVLSLSRNSSSTPAAGLGSGLVLKGKSTTTNDQIMGEFAAAWVDPTHATRKSQVTIKPATASGLSTIPLRYYSSGYLTNGPNTDIGIAAINASGGFTVNNTTATAGTILQGVGGVFAATTYTLPSSPGASGNVMTSNGTNWVSSLPTGGGGGTFNPAIDNLFTAFQSITTAPAPNLFSDGLVLQDTTLAPSSGNQQYSPGLRFLANGWKTGGTSGSQPVEYRNYVVPTQGGASPTGRLLWERQINNTGWNTVMNLSTTGGLTIGGPVEAPAGIVNAVTGYRVNSVSPTAGHVLRSAGGGWFVDGQVDFADLTGLATEAQLNLTDVTTGNVSTSAHGFAPKGDGNAAHFLNGTGAYSSPSGGFNSAADNLFTAPQSITTAPASNTSSEGLMLQDTTPAPSSGNQQYSPALHYTGQGWKTAITAGSQPVEVRSYLIPTQATANPTGRLVWESQINSAGWTSKMALSTAGGLTVGSATEVATGIINAVTGYKINTAAAAAGHVLRGNGANYVDGQVDFSDLTGTAIETQLNLTDVTTGNVSTSAHGFAPKGDGNAAHYLDGTGAYSTPAGGAGVTTTGTPANGNLTKFSGTGTITNGNLTGDVTTSGTLTTSIQNLPDGVTQAGSIVVTDVAAPGNPAAAHLYVYGDSTDLRLHDKNAAGTVATTVVPASATTNQFVTGLLSTGVLLKAQAAFSNLSGTWTLAQGDTSSSTANKVLMSGASAAPTWSTPAFPNASGANGNVMTSDGTNWTSGAPTHFIICLTSAYTLTSQTAAQALFNAPANGAFTATANTTYRFRTMFALTAMSATSGSYGFGFGGTATRTREAWESDAVKTAALNSNATSPIHMWNTTATTTLMAANVNTTGHCQIEGIIRVGTGGTIIPQVSLTVAAAAIVSVDSFFEIWPVGADTVQSVGNWT